MHRPQPTHVYEIEGGMGVTWAEWKNLPVPSRAGKRAHAIRFDDGATFDLQGGWRERTADGWRRIEDNRIDGTGWAEAAFCDDVDPAQREIGMTPTSFNAASRQQMAAARWPIDNG